jgi:hypothetical protein
MAIAGLIVDFVRLNSAGISRSRLESGRTSVYWRCSRFTHPLPMPFINRWMEATLNYRGRIVMRSGVFDNAHGKRSFKAGKPSTHIVAYDGAGDHQIANR